MKKLTKKEKQEIAFRELATRASDPKVIQEALELKRKMTRNNWEDMNRPFTI
jgi:GrpB-like predicted nucleotidyltransferase (UPF0157 family)